MGSENSEASGIREALSILGGVALVAIVVVVAVPLIFAYAAMGGQSARSDRWSY